MNIGQQGQGDEQLRMQGQQPPPPHRRCPRCNSNNTKFCYFNNYSLSQPRYFCKACRRYWTHGGMLRNVPIGGNSRRGKRSRNSNSNSPSQQPPPPPPPQQPEPTMMAYVAPPPPPPPPSSSTIEPGVVWTAKQPSMTSSSYYGDGGSGGYLSLLTAPMHDVNQLPQGLNYNATPNLIFGGDARGGGSNSHLGFLQGFNIPHVHQAAQVYQMGNNKANTLIRSVYSPPDLTTTTSQEGFTQASNNMAIAFSQPDFSQGFISRANSTSAWSNNANGSINCGSSSSGHAARWPDVPGFGRQ